MRNVYVKNNKILVLLKNETKQHNMTVCYVTQRRGWVGLEGHWNGHGRFWKEVILEWGRAEGEIV